MGWYDEVVDVAEVVGMGVVVLRGIGGEVVVGVVGEVMIVGEVGAVMVVGEGADVVLIGVVGDVVVGGVGRDVVLVGAIEAVIRVVAGSVGTGVPRMGDRMVVVSGFKVWLVGIFTGVVDA